VLLGACAIQEGQSLPPLAPAKGASIASCSELARTLALPDTRFTGATLVAAGTLTVAGQPVGEHCHLTGRMHERVSAVDGKSYAIGFEMRLPAAWNERFFYQANGGLDGNVAPALGGVGGGGATTNALHTGFAVLSSDAGHAANQNPAFGIDPQARLDYGYQAVGKLTPMARRVVQAAYGKTPDRMYLGGCSNGGRHALVAAARYADQYDGILAGNPGFNLPKSAVAQLYGAQQFASVASENSATGRPDIASAFTPAERTLLANRIVARCDALDGARDGMVQDVKGCQAVFKLDADVPTCGAGGRDGSCLSTGQKSAIAKVFAGARNSAGEPLYASFPFDRGIAGADWAEWKLKRSAFLDPMAVGYVFTAPPAAPAVPDGLLPFALGFSMDRDAPKIAARHAAYTESALEFMTPPDASRLATLKQRGGKLIVYHGTADGVFSSDDTMAWYNDLRAAHGGDASGFARYFPVPAMNHCSGGPSTDQFNMLSALVAWVEQGHAPDRVIATARGPGAATVNPEVPASWSPQRTRPLCPYPRIARYQGSGSLEQAENFACQ
jgi:feruloyl esterase